MEGEEEEWQRYVPEDWEEDLLAFWARNRGEHFAARVESRIERGDKVALWEWAKDKMNTIKRTAPPEYIQLLALATHQDLTYMASKCSASSVEERKEAEVEEFCRRAFAANKDVNESVSKPTPAKAPEASEAPTEQEQAAEDAGGVRSECPSGGRTATRRRAAPAAALRAQGACHRRRLKSSRVVPRAALRRSVKTTSQSARGEGTRGHNHAHEDPQALNWRHGTNNRVRGRPPERRRRRRTRSHARAGQSKSPHMPQCAARKVKRRKRPRDRHNHQPRGTHGQRGLARRKVGGKPTGSAGRSSTREGKGRRHQPSAAPGQRRRARHAAAGGKRGRPPEPPNRAAPTSGSRPRLK